MQFTKNADQRRSQGLARVQTVACLVLATLLFAGCTAQRYRKAADREIYSIIEQVEHGVFGRTNEFSINTPYSDRKPGEILPQELIEDRLEGGQRVLPLEEALELAAQSSRRYQLEKERLFLTALTLSGERHNFGPQFFATSRARWNRTAGGEQFVTVNNDVGVGQFLKTGGSLSVALANDILRYYTGDPRRSVVSLISVNLTQPLLRGFGRNNPAVESLTQAERNVVYAVRAFSYFQQQFSVEIVSDYFFLVQQKDIIRNQYTNYLNRVQDRRRLEARAEDRESQAGVDQARQGELSARNNYVNALANYRNGLDQFKIELGLPVSEEIALDDTVLAELRDSGLMPVLMSPEEAFRFAVEQQLVLLNSIDRFEDSKRKISVAKDRLRPGLTLVSSASLESERPTDYTRFHPDDIRVSAGLELDLPLDRLRERNNYRATLISFESEVRNLTLALDSLKGSIERGVRTLEQRRQNYLIQLNSLEVASRRIENQEIRLEFGAGEVRDLVEARDAQVQAQNALTVALVNYQQTRLQLMLDIGTLQTDLPRFWLQDHLTGMLPGVIPPEVLPTPDQEVVSPDQFFNLNL